MLILWDGFEEHFKISLGCSNLITVCDPHSIGPQFFVIQLGKQYTPMLQ